MIDFTEYDTFGECIDLIYERSHENGEFKLGLDSESIVVKIQYSSINRKLKFIIDIIDEVDDHSIEENNRLYELIKQVSYEYNIDFECQLKGNKNNMVSDCEFSLDIASCSKDDLKKFVNKLEKDYILYKKGFKSIISDVKFRPKARLLSILGEQLISNEIVAIKELVLNCFDADATKIDIIFIKNDSGKICEIEIRDNGVGMDEERLINGWFTPATSIKTKAKKDGRTKLFNRPILGEKGVGRFACRRLGEKLEIVTIPSNRSKELFFNIEWMQYDVDSDDVYLDQINNSIYSKEIIDKCGVHSGTIIKISDLKDNWDDNRVERIKIELRKLIPPFQQNKDFNIYINSMELDNNVFLEKALYYIEGIVDSKGILRYILGSYPREHTFKPGDFIASIDFNKDIDEQLIEFDYKKESLIESQKWTSYLKNQNRVMDPACGNFTFAAYSWDLDPVHTKRVGINDRASKSLLKELSGVSIYRDGFRVWPYGDKGNDWLQLEKRAQGKKSLHIVNHQVIGYVGITQEHNPYFRDKTNREGFIETDIVFSDFQVLCLLTFEKLEELRYKSNSKERPVKDKEWWQEDKVINELKDLIKVVEEKAPELLKEVHKLKNTYELRKNQTESKITNLLETSSSGIVFESVTHELISFLVKMDDQSKNIENQLLNDPPDIKAIAESNILLNEALKIVLYEVKELQPFFKSARYQIKEIDIKEVCEKVMGFFKRKLKANNIRYVINEITPMKKRAVEGFIMQILTNLIDNSVYWLDFDINDSKEILITIDGNNNSIYFSDNGKGISDEDKPYIFDPFFTKKVDGRGLGLYIAQELLSNYRGTICLEDGYKPKSCNEKRKGTCFKIMIS